MLGVGGYGHYYIEGLERLSAEQRAELVAIVDPGAERALDWPELKSLGIPVFSSLEDFLRAPVEVDLAVVSTPISLHADHSCALLEAGINVLCEKPIAATSADVERMRAARDASGKFLEIGYQWSFSETMQRLKADVLSGAYGLPQCCLTRVAWPRPQSYYTRNNWAGKIRNPQGAPVYDSPVNNATAHFLQNMLYILGPSLELSAKPTSVTAECYRANPIENYDTACLRIDTSNGMPIYFYTTHAVETNDGPVFLYQFESAEIRYRLGGDVVAQGNDGSTKNYGNPESTHMRKLESCVEKCLAEGVVSATCSVEAVCAHTHCVEALQAVGVKDIPNEFLAKKEMQPGDVLTYLPDMETMLSEAFDQQKLFSELNLPWAVKPTTVPIPDNL
ncbi:Gfo/Idh/MocA family protein [Cerasicoccus frondis]|uniref:Gfo/Idh/MocA family protein n=1 Tax=Cerasicoccus frondis TaxID=490090 RepID=UPI00285289B6|nr:Gfo/Idh/MocA family oxidoreductase [Cerasicoccus frondis]